MNIATLDERDLIQSAQQGDTGAFRRLAEHHSPRLCSCAITLCRDGHLAEDLAQETLLEAWRSLTRFDGRVLFSTWLYAILRHRYLKHLRRPGSASHSTLESTASANLEQSQVAPVEAAERSEDSQRLQIVVGQLPEEHRQVIELRFFADCNLDEIAATLGCPLGTVKSRLHHGLKKLREMSLNVNLFPQERESIAR